MKPVFEPRFAIAILMLGVAASSHAASYAVSSLGKTEIVGSTSAVPGGGTPSNFSVGTVTVGDSFANFQLLIAGSSTRFADMKVTLSGLNGTLNTAGGGSGLMIAQTSNSQNLTDSGTLSVLTGFSSLGANQESSVTLRFDFYEPDTTTQKNVALQLTSFDYDYNQFMEIETADFTAAAHGAKLTRTDTSPTIRFADTTNSDATFNQSSNAVVLNSNPINSGFAVTLGKAGIGNSLFMFEFRDPSTNLDSELIPTPIPEPSSALLTLACGAGLLLGSRRR